jgi:protein-disulfide isomerase
MNQVRIGMAIFIGLSLVALAIILPTYIERNQQVIVTNGAEALTRGEAARRYGAADAETVIVEFSDLECPFCAQLHGTLKNIVDASSGTIAWEYRHLPLPSHRFAKPAAMLSECVGDVVGNDAFFTYLEDVFLADSLSLPVLMQLAEKYGFDEATVTSCLSDPVLSDRIDLDVAVATANGARGTPFSIILRSDGTTKVAAGALPLSEWNRLLQ